jgi:hypothetical protein
MLRTHILLYLLVLMHSEASQSASQSAPKATGAAVGGDTGQDDSTCDGGVCAEDEEEEESGNVLTIKNETDVSGTRTQITQKDVPNDQQVPVLVPVPPVPTLV